MKGAAAKGAATTIATQLTRFVSQVGSTLILARLLAPADFGIYAMTTPVVAIAIMLQDLGLTQAVITARSIDKRVTSAMFYANFGLSLFIAAMIAVSATLIGAFYKAPAVVPVMQFMALGLLVTGASAVHRALLTRALRYATLARIEIVAVLIGTGASIAHAWWAPSPLALATAVVVTGLVQLVQSWIATRWTPGRPGNREKIAEMLRFGGGMTGFNLTNFVARNADNVIIGRGLGAGELGFYDRAYKLMMLPLNQFNGPAGRVMVPILSKLVDEPARYRHAYLRTLRILLLFSLPVVCFCIATAYQLIPFLLGPQWFASSEIFLWLAIAAFHQPLTATLGWLFISQSRTGQFAKWGVVNAVTCVAAFFAGLPWGAAGVAAAYALSDLAIRMPAVWWYAGRQGPVRTRDLVGVGWRYGMAAVALLAMLSVARELLQRGGASDLAILLLLGPLAFFAFWGIVFCSAQGRTSIGEVFDLFRERVRLARVNFSRRGA